LGPYVLYYIYMYLCNKESIPVICLSLFCFLHFPLSTARYCNTLSALSQGEIREGEEEEHAVLDKNNKIDLHINSKVWNIPFPCAYAVCAKFCTLLMIRCWRRSPLVKPQRFHRCMRSLNAVCKCKMCTSAFSMDGQRWFRCRWCSVDSPLHPRRHRRRCLTRDRLHRPPWMSIWRHHHRLRPLQRQLLVVRHLHQCLWSSGPLLPIVGSPRVPSMLHVDALSSLAIAQMVWPRLPPPTGGPNGPRSGRRVGRLGGGGGERRDKPRRVRDLRGTTGVGARRGPPRRGRSARAPPTARGVAHRRRSARLPWRARPQALAPAAGTRGRSARARHQRGQQASTRFGKARAASSQAAAAACWPGERATCCLTWARGRPRSGRALGAGESPHGEPAGHSAWRKKAAAGSSLLPSGGQENAW
jgi:hypothetical protein